MNPGIVDLLNLSHVKSIIPPSMPFLIAFPVRTKIKERSNIYVSEFDRYAIKNIQGNSFVNQNHYPGNVVSVLPNPHPLHIYSACGILP